MKKPTISIVIPTLNEETGIGDLLDYIQKLPGYDSSCEIIMVDGGSKDKTVTLAKQRGVVVITTPPGRSHQMNIGANLAKAGHLFFLHADSYPPKTFFFEINEAIRSNLDAGCFRLKFDNNHPILRFYAWFTRYDFQPFRFGDQGFFIKKSIFEILGGFNESFIVMEDNDIIKRLKSEGFQLKIWSSQMQTSARRYIENGVLKLQLVFAAIYLLHNAGIPHDELKRFFKIWISGRPVV